MIKAVEKANEYQKNVIFSKMTDILIIILKTRLLVSGDLSFKPKTDDIREASSIDTYRINFLLAGARVKAYDPAAMNEAKKLLGNKIEYATDPYEALTDADAMALMTEWSEFHLPDFNRMADLMKGKVIFDGRNIYDPAELKKHGI